MMHWHGRQPLFFFFFFFFNRGSLSAVAPLNFDAF